MLANAQNMGECQMSSHPSPLRPGIRDPDLPSPLSAQTQRLLQMHSEFLVAKIEPVLYPTLKFWNVQAWDMVEPSCITRYEKKRNLAAGAGNIPPGLLSDSSF